MEEVPLEHPPEILIVDDMDRNLRLLEGFLTPLGYRVNLARDGWEALEKVRRHPPDVILLDVLLPGLNGFKVVEQLKEDEETRIIPVVMVTTLSGREERVKALAAGADDFLSRPVNWAELQARVQALLKVKAHNDRMKDYQQSLEAEVTQHTEALRLAYESIRRASLDTIHRLARAAEYRDEGTGAHIRRMSHYAATVARQMGQSERMVESLLYAAPMHDVGKISVPDHILLKPGKLDPDEWAIMKAHTTIGGRILAESEAELIQLAEVIALTHHERWDGRGYPKGLKGTAIPLAGRITAIADVFDALTSDRPYRKALALEQAFDILKTGRGSHFDPDVVEAFFAAEGEILSIMRDHKA